MTSLFVKIVVFTPVSHADIIRQVLSNVGAGTVGNYDSCSFSSKGIGRFRPLEGAHPTLGTVGKLEMAEEEKIETICPKKSLKKIIQAIKKAHPYEEPVIDVYPLLNLP